MNTKPSYVMLHVYHLQGSSTSSKINWVLEEQFLIPFKNKKSFNREFEEFVKKYIKSSAVLYTTSSSKLLGYGFSKVGGDVKIEGYYLDYFRKRI